jgi:hypothetical protein
MSGWWRMKMTSHSRGCGGGYKIESKKNEKERKLGQKLGFNKIVLI